MHERGWESLTLSYPTMQHVREWMDKEQGFRMLFHAGKRARVPYRGNVGSTIPGLVVPLKSWGSERGLHTFAGGIIIPTQEGKIITTRHALFEVKGAVLSFWK
eukprot:scaffold2490_cov169-Amphora_coffeaeformis.AAC.12